MRYEIVLAPGAVQGLRSLSAHHRAQVRDSIERHLRHEPTKLSKSRIKRLQGLSRPQYRLRIGDFRVFYDVTDEAVEVLVITSKAEAQARLQREGKSNEESGTGQA